MSDSLDLSRALQNYEDLPVLFLFQSLHIPVSKHTDAESSGLKALH